MKGDLLASSPVSPASPRLKSLDVFRGATIAAMILVNGQFSSVDSYRQFTHAAWNGWTFADTIFPFFLFIVGASLALSTASRVARGEARGQNFAHVVRRSILLFAIGVMIEYVRVPSHDLILIGFSNHLQLSGALQKIAVCYLVAAAIYYAGGVRGVVAAIFGLNLMYLALLYLYPVPVCGPGSLTLTCNFPGYLDTVVLDGLRNGTPFDPDGVGSILPATSSVLLGVLAGLLTESVTQSRLRIRALLGYGIILTACGELLATWIPINKQLWTPPFAVLTAGLAAAGLACAIRFVDGRPTQVWSRPLELLGMNAIAAYVISRFVENVPRVHVQGKSLYVDVLLRVASPPNASLLFAMLVLSLVYLAVWSLDRWGWRFKL